MAKSDPRKIAERVVRGGLTAHDELATLARAYLRLRKKNSELQRWIDDLQSEMYINCVYCGHRYGPDDGDHLVSMRDALREHIAACPKHPLSKALAQLTRLRAAAEEESLKSCCRINPNLLAALREDKT